MNRLSRTMLLLRSIKHTPKIQVLNRLKLKIKRSTMVKVAQLFPKVAMPKIVKTRQLSTDLPKSLLPHPAQKTQFIDGSFAFTFLNKSRDFSLPINWHKSELNVGTRLWKLNLHYFDYTENLTDDEFSALVTDWISQNRPYRTGYWFDSWNSYAISIRLVAWMGEFQTRHKRLDKKMVETWKHSIQEQLGFLQNNLERDIGGNHIVKNIRALYWGAKFFSNTGKNEFALLADQLLSVELENQILDDGFHFELSPAYHCLVFGDLLDCWRLMPENDLKGKLAKKLIAMAQVIADLTHPDGHISLFNDGGLNMALAPKVLLKIYAQLFEEKPTQHTHICYPNAGYNILRTDNYYLVYDAGRVGPDGLPAHAHGDIFSFELTVGTQRIFVDTGVFEYNAGSLRTRSRATVAHNTLNLDSLDQCEFWSAFRLGYRADIKILENHFDGTSMIVSAEHNGYQKLSGGPTHKRNIKASLNNVIKIKDQVIKGNNQQAAAHLLLHPEVKILEQDNGFLLLEAAQHIVRLNYSGYSIKIIPTHWWPDFGVRLDTKQIILEYGQAPGEWSFEIEILESK